MAIIQKQTFVGTTSSSSLWTWKIEVIEETGDSTNLTSPVTVKLYLGRTTSGGRSYFGGSCKLNYKVGGNSFSENWSKSSYTYINGGEWYNIGSHTFNVTNVGGPNTYSVSGYMRNATFNPSSADASGNITLAVLHTPPDFDPTYIAYTELNPLLSGYNITNQIVKYLSEKSYHVENCLTFYDSSTLSTINIYYGTTLIGTSSSYIVEADMRPLNIIETTTCPIIFEIIDSKNGITRQTVDFPLINYFKPILNDSLCTITRYTNSTTSLVDSKCTININGSYFYDSNTTFGQSVVINHIYYKIWKSSETEPSSYIDIVSDPSVSRSNGNVTVNDKIIDQIDYTYSWLYKIYITDNYGNESQIKQGSVPTGRAVWTEYSDHVDFYGLTIKDVPILMPYSLYDNSTGSTGNIILSDSTANYEYIEIFYKDDINQYSSAKFYKPNGKRITLFMSVINPSNSQTFIQTSCKDISGANITHNKASEIRLDVHNANTSNYIAIIKVIGYK